MEYIVILYTLVELMYFNYFQNHISLLMRNTSLSFGTIHDLISHSSLYVTKIICLHVQLSYDAIHKHCTFTRLSVIKCDLYEDSFGWVIHFFNVCRWWTRKSRRRLHCNSSFVQNSIPKTSPRNWYKILRCDFFTFR